MNWDFDGLPKAAGFYPAIVRDDSELYPTGLFFDGVAWRRQAPARREGDYSRPAPTRDDDLVPADQVAAFLPLIYADKVTARETAEERLLRFLKTQAPGNDVS